MPSSNLKSVLVIEDDHDTRVTLRQVLENSGFKVYSAANGKEGIQILKTSRPNLVLLDLVMPLMDGEEFLQEKKVHQSMANIPVIVISSFKDRIDALGDNTPYLLKPLDLESLTSHVESYFP